MLRKHVYTESVVKKVVKVVDFILNTTADSSEMRQVKFERVCQVVYTDTCAKYTFVRRVI